MDVWNRLMGCVVLANGYHDKDIGVVHSTHKIHPGIFKRHKPMKD